MELNIFVAQQRPAVTFILKYINDVQIDNENNVLTEPPKDSCVYEQTHITDSRGISHKVDASMWQTKLYKVLFNWKIFDEYN